MKQRPRLPEITYAGAVLLVVVAAVVVLRLNKGSVAFCQEVLNELAAGDFSVRHAIDWEHLNALGIDVGKDYAKLPDAQAQEMYQQAFILGFSAGFKRSGGDAKGFTGWRIHNKTPDYIIVAAKHPLRQKTLLLAIPASGKKQLVGIHWADLDADADHQ